MLVTSTGAAAPTLLYGVSLNFAKPFSVKAEFQITLDAACAAKVHETMRPMVRVMIAAARNGPRGAVTGGESSDDHDRVISL